jgi:heterodisulfide reductase subunit A
MMDAGRHPKITLLTNSELVALKGEAGNFKATIHTEPRYVDLDKCVGCAACEEVCPVIVPNEFDVGLKARKAIYRPFPQAVPTAYVLDRENCLNGEFLFCQNCVRACERDAIDFDMQPEDRSVEVGAVIAAVGFREFDAYGMGSFGYGRFHNVLSGLEFERLLNASGPTRGHILRPSDGTIPKSLAWVQCVGSRGEAGHPYCSRYCCMNAAKGAMLALQHEPGIERIYIFCTDLRAFGKGYDAFMDRVAKEERITFVRGRPSKIVPTERGNPILRVEVEGKPEEVEVEMAVLSAGAVPEPTLAKLADVLGLPLGKEGFMLPREVGTTVVDSPRDGIYLCGGVTGPQVIPEAVASGSAAASHAAAHLGEPEPVPAQVTPEPVEIGTEPRLGVIVCHCGANIAGVLNVDRLVDSARGLPGVVFADDELFACADVGQQKIQEAIREHKLTRLVVAACTPRTHEPVFRKAASQVGLNPYLVEMANIRDQCSWVHAGDRDEATRRAADQIKMAAARAHLLEPLQPMQVPMERSGLVVGGGPAGLEAALSLARRGLKVTLVEQRDRLGGLTTHPTLGRLYPALAPSRPWIEEKLQALQEAGVEVLLGTTVAEVNGFIGNFEVTLATTGADGEKRKVVRTGVIILAIGAALYNPKGRYGYGTYPNVVTNMELEELLTQGKLESATGGKKPQSVVFIQCVGSRGQEGNPGCSRYCCPTTVKQAKELRDRGIEVAVFHRDIRTVDMGTEELYREARGAGVLFLRVPEGERPEVVGDGTAHEVVANDVLLREEVAVPADLVVLAVGMVPREPDFTVLQHLFKVPRSPDGFLLERHPELAPVETPVEGVFICGSLQGPKGLADTSAQAAAAAVKAGIYMAKPEVTVEPTVASVDNAKCRGCGACVSVCPYQAIAMDEDRGVAVVVAAQCKGCGTCAAWCPTGALHARHFTDQQIGAMVEAALEGLDSG